MASLNLKNIYKVYPNGTKAVNDFSMDIEDKEFIVFVGPSGCGKSTVLRMIAGLEEISAGELKIDDAVVNDVDCMHRDTAMVFQNYALYPHMTVAENMAFPLKMAKLTKEEKQELSRRTDEKYPLYRKLTAEEREEFKKAKASKPKPELSKEDKAEIKKVMKESYPKSLWNLIVYPIHYFGIKRKYVAKYYPYEGARRPSLWNNLLKPVHRSKVKQDEMLAEVEHIAEILGLEEYLGKKPGAMSGGQRQRVALGRAMVRNPKVFLLDEPLSNLDAKLRTAMRSEITKLHKRLQTTFIYVTHDQTEAMTMGDRIVVMKKGVIQQIDTPLNLYTYPENLFVAGFIGTPAMNFFDAVVTVEGDGADVVFANGKKLACSYPDIRKMERKYFGKTVTMGVRPEHFRISEEGVECVVVSRELLGSDTLLYCDFDTVHTNDYEKSSYGFIVKTEGSSIYNSGDKIKVTIDFGKAHFFDKQTEESVSKRLVRYNDAEVCVKEGKLIIGGQAAALPAALSSLDGALRAIIPTDSFRLGVNEYAAKVAECEQIGKKYLALLSIGTEMLYAQFDREVSGEIKVGLQTRKIKFMRGEEVIKDELDVQNKLPAVLKKRKLTSEVKKNLPKEEYRDFDIDVAVGDVSLTAPLITAKRLLGASDRKIFDLPAALSFNEKDVREGDAFTATVREVYDYGFESYALCQCKDAELILPYRGESDKISFTVDLITAQIIDEKSGIRIS